MDSKSYINLFNGVVSRHWEQGKLPNQVMLCTCRAKMIGKKTGVIPNYFKLLENKESQDIIDYVSRVNQYLINKYNIAATRAKKHDDQRQRGGLVTSATSLQQYREI